MAISKTRYVKNVVKPVASCTLPHVEYFEYFVCIEALPPCDFASSPVLLHQGRGGAVAASPDHDLVHAVLSHGLLLVETLFVVHGK